MIDGFGPREDRRGKNPALAATDALNEAGANHRRRPRQPKAPDMAESSEEAAEIAELLDLFGHGKARKPAWDSTPYRPRPAALSGLKPITREPWAVDEEVYNKKFETRDVGVPDRYLDRTARALQLNQFANERAYNAFDRRFAEDSEVQMGRSGARMDALGGVHRPPPPRSRGGGSGGGNAASKPRAASKPSKAASGGKGGGAPPDAPAAYTTKPAPKPDATQFLWPHNKDSWMPDQRQWP